MMDAKLAIEGGAPNMSQELLNRVPKWPQTYPGVAERLVSLYYSRAWSFGGVYEQRFNNAFAAHHSAHHGIFMVNGTVTIESALQALGVHRGDEVIIPALTWMATAMAAKYLGAKVVFADIQPDTLCLDPDALEKAITPRTKAIVPVHIYGSMADMEAIMDIANRHGIAVVEDCAHAHGGVWNGRGVGSIGDVGSFSLQQSKTLTSGEGGICITNNTDLASTIYRLKHIGYDQQTPQGAASKTPPTGLLCHNYRGTEFQAAVLLGGLDHLQEETELRDRNAGRIREALADVPGISVQSRGRLADRQGYYSLMFLLDPDVAGVSSKEFATAMKAEGIGCGRTYGPVYGHKLWNVSRNGYRLAGDGCPVCDDACANRAVTISHPWLLSDEEVIDGVIETVKKVLAAYRRR